MVCKGVFSIGLYREMIGDGHKIRFWHDVYWMRQSPSAYSNV